MLVRSSKTVWRVPPRAVSLGAMFVALWVIGCRTAPIQNVVDAPLSPHGSVALEDIDEAIWRAGRKLGWSIEPVGAGQLRGTLRVRRHVAVVSIRHDDRHFTIAYESSENLAQHGAVIHRNDNLWVARLAAKIQAEPIIRRPRYEPPS